MARLQNRLTATQVRHEKRSGVRSDGGGLYLRVAAGGTKSWIFIYHWHQRRREMGLGGVDSVSLAKAREKAAAARAQVADGIDPVAARKALNGIPTFGELADLWITEQSKTIRGQKTVARWTRALGSEGYAQSLRSLRVDHVDTDAVVSVLSPIWTRKVATARNVRAYIESVLDYAAVGKHRSGENPARWRGHLEHLLAETRSRGEGHAAMPWKDVPKFVKKLGGRSGTAARALEFTILSASRTGETIGATWGEFDLDGGIWTIPATRMKAGVAHVVPLSKQALKVLGSVRPPQVEPGTFVFGGAKALSNMSMLMLLKRIWPGVTVHGFRSAFRDWAGDVTDYPREIAEMALAHTVGGATELAYRRGRALEKRRAMMQDWADFVVPVSVPLQQPRKAADAPQSRRRASQVSELQVKLFG